MEEVSGAQCHPRAADDPDRPIESSTRAVDRVRNVKS